MSVAKSTRPIIFGPGGEKPTNPEEGMLLFSLTFKLLVFSFHAFSSLFGDEDHKLAFLPMLLKVPLLLRQPPNGAEHKNNGLTHPNTVKPLSRYSIPATNLCIGQRGLRLKRNPRLTGIYSTRALLD
jgi:hypothetical protein